ncbi:unnamed protein product [Bursaphelenchus xylophilus]|uniref:Proton-coupled zinc antiporter SLC30A5 n=1 Tax=Bursaphelenchus xylophilus TaxID=6326 RepID=A0A1I7RRN1_BURXY|nr:unnamed protein product [Bursaphelenchus xylophilus]CAG9123624.1 unnamed protein product [Bursaphelenchus xylophilus]
MLVQDFGKKDVASPSNSKQYFFLLIIAKVLRCFGIFLSHFLAKQVHVVTLLWLMKIMASSILVPLQKPFANGKSIRKSVHVRIAQLAFYNSLVEVLWFYGITFCGPLRSILVFEQSPTVMFAAVTALIGVNGSTSKTRGVWGIIFGFLILFFMDEDSTVELNHSEAHKHQGGLNHMFYHVLSWFGISDHKGGVVVLLFTLFLKMGYDSQFRHVAVEIGGSKRLHAMVSVMSGLFLTPFAVFSILLSSSHIDGFFSFLVVSFIAAAFLFVIDFNTEQICFKHDPDPVMTAARWSPITMFVCSFIISWLWYARETVAISDHPLSAGVFLTTVLFCFASLSITSSKEKAPRGGHYIGLSNDGKPLYSYGEAFLKKTSKSILHFCQETMKEILDNSDSRRIFYFLCANLAFCGVEFLYGFLTNSLGLISDGFHMLFDCLSLVMGLVASVASRWISNRTYSFGYGRVEVLSGFINAMFLSVIAFFIFLEAVGRLYSPPDINTDKLMLVAVAGLLINIYGMYAFHGDHGHSHGGGDHGHSHHGHSHGGNANMQGVFLHVLADTLGSVFVIISTLFLQYFGWKWVDPLCSLVLSLLIGSSVFPLLKSSGSVLLQCIPDEIEEEVDHVYDEILNVNGVKSLSDFHLWQLKSEANVATICIQVYDNMDEEEIRYIVRQIMKRYGVQQMTIQVEKTLFETRVQSRIPGYRRVGLVDRSSFIPSANHSHSHGIDHGHSHSDVAHGHSHHGQETCQNGSLTQHHHGH